YQAYSQAKTYAEKSKDYKEDESFMDIKITDDDGNKAVAKDWIKDEANKIMLNLIALDYLVAKDDASWDEASMESAKSTAQDSWDMGPYASYGYYQPQKDELSKYGVSFESFSYASYEASVKQNALFNKLYDKGGLEEVSDKDLTDYFVENYVDYSYIPVNLYKSSTDADGNSTSKKFSDKKIKRIKNELEEIADELSSGDTTFGKAAKKCEKNYDTASADEVKDTVSTKKDLESNNADIYKAVNKLSAKKASVITVGEDGDSPIAYIVVRNDIKKDIDDYIKSDSNRSTVLQNMKSEDLNDLIEKTGKELEKSDALAINEGAVNKYDSNMFYVKPEATTAANADNEDSNS
ncbi:MAG: hypothetical protein J1E41_08050, partial [Ruminococcus sp.]|nr:hypothetical protein [Ruminococcus sp.]